MEYLEASNRNQERMERLVLISYGIYNILLCLELLRRPGMIVSVVAMLLSMVIAWGAKIANMRTINFRAGVAVLMIETSMILYTLRLPDIYDALPFIFLGAVLVAFYGIPELLLGTFTSTAVIFLYHFLAIRSIPFESGEKLLHAIFMMINVFLAEFLLYYLVKQRQKNIKQFYKIIDALQRAEQSKDDFLANVSHEIRTPINTICGMSELVQGEEEPQKMRDALFDIQQAGRNLLSLVSDILDFSELQSGKIALEEEEYNISSTINDVINMSLAKKKQKNIELIVDCDASIPKGLLGDEKKLRRIIMNLVHNAIKFTNEGCVTIQVSSRQEEYGVNLIITVKDTGIGMEAESMEKLFTSFSQIDTRRNHQEGGIGLGLAISKALVECMGGVIAIKSKFGKGTAVRVVVPQKVIDAQPIAQLENTENINVAVYVDMEQFGMVSIRDEYAGNIRHMVEQLKAKCHICRNLAELKRWEKKEKFTHIIISVAEYEEEPRYFDTLAESIPVIVILEREDDEEISNPNIMRIFKPFYILPIVNVINQGIQKDVRTVHQRKFIAPGACVLVVDDNLMNIRVIEGILEKYQIRVVRAMSGHEALKKIESKEFDFVFMDHMMPEMDGVETFHRIRSKAGKYFQNVPIVALTANAIAGSRERFLEEGFNDFLEKPVELSVLERVLQRTLKEERIQYVDSVQEEVAEESRSESDKSDIPIATAAMGAADVFMIGNLDVDKGMTFCGGREKYLEILAGCYEESASFGGKLETLYHEENWQEYTIAVHALKSTMMSIGAVQLSGQAKELELAGKAGDIARIHDRQASLMAEYRRVMRLIAEEPMVNTAEMVGIEQIDLSNNRDSDALSANEADSGGQIEELQILPELSDEEFDSMYLELEDAAYGLDGEEMQEVLEELSRYRYHNQSMRKAVKPAFRKIGMSDYLSALEMVGKVREKLQLEEE